MEEKDDELQNNFGATKCSIKGLAPLGTADTAGHRHARIFPSKKSLFFVQNSPLFWFLTTLPRGDICSNYNIKFFTFFNSTWA